MNSQPNLSSKILEMAGRIKELREIAGYSPEEMAAKTDVSVSEYRQCESGEADLTFAFIYRCAQALAVDVTDIIEGASPVLSSYTLTRNGEGQRVARAHNMVYHNLAAQFKNRIAEPLQVKAIYDESLQNQEIEVTTHSGQECDIIISGQLKVRVGDHTETLGPGDSIYYNSSTPHGMIAVGGRDCLFYAIVLNPTGEPIPGLSTAGGEHIETAEKVPEPKVYRIYRNYISTETDDNGALQKISFHDEQNFNFAFDIVDAIAEKSPDKLAMLHLDVNKNERRFTFEDISRNSSRAANYFKSLGIKKGDRVLLVLRRHYQFWIAMMGLHKIGAIAVLATDQLQEKDFQYRFEAAGISAILCTAFGQAAEQAELAIANCPEVKTKIIVDGEREGWHDFDSEYLIFRSSFPRPDDAACGDDLMLMFFTSGTTGYPKMAVHSYKYALGHFVTAKYWHRVNANGLHFTISDTGWAKSMWGKLYGQWLCEAAVFTYDFDRFDAHDILPLFSKYQITTFCAPPTMYRFMIKEDITKYDLSSIQHASTAGEALNPEVFHQFQKATGIAIREGFGQSETTVMIGNFAGMTPRFGSMGQPNPLYHIDLLDKGNKPTKVGEIGEIVIGTEGGIPNGLFQGYYRDEEKTVEAWHDGYYHTGDTAWRDEDGYYWYVGRVDDLIKSSGYRIGPFEIESVIMELPYILECAVSPEPDEIRGQIVKASIVLTKGTEPSEKLKKEIQTYVKQRTAPYKYPRIVVFRDELPKTVSGKIIRKQL